VRRQAVFVCYISGHGLGHAARQIEVIRALSARQPGARFITRTSAPSWFVSLSAPAGVELHADDVDSGVAQAARRRAPRHPLDRAHVDGRARSAPHRELPCSSRRDGFIE
jgi:hypothetical protein